MMVRCPVNSDGYQCPTDVQRTVAGTVADGLREHMKYVHPELHEHTVAMLVHEATS